MLFIERETDAASSRFGKVKAVYSCAQLGTLTDAVFDEDGNVVKPAVRADDAIPTEEVNDTHPDVVEFYAAAAALVAVPVVDTAPENKAREDFSKALESLPEEQQAPLRLLLKIIDAP